MKRRLLMLIMLFGLIVVLGACGQMADSDTEDETGQYGFQDNGPSDPDELYSNFKLLSIFDGRNSLEDIWDSVDAIEVNNRLACNIENYTSEFLTFSDVAAEILTDSDQPVAALLSTDVANLLGYLRSEDTFFMESDEDIGAFYTKTPEEYADDFYSFLDALWEGDHTPGEQEVVAILRKVVQRMLDKKSALEILEDMQDLIDDIEDDDFDRDFGYLSSLIGKLMIQADYPLWVDDGGVPVNRAEIDPDLDKNLGLGNAVQGMNSMVNWMNTVMANDETREIFYNVIRETVRMFDPSESSENAEKTKTLLQNTEDLFTEGGAVYESNSLYNEDSDAIYRDTELGLTLREFMPYFMQLIVRSDRDLSMAYTGTELDPDTGEPYDEPVYMLREMVTALKNIGYDPDELSLEDGLKMMMQYDLLGRDRTLEDSGAFPASFLESLVFLTCATTHFGWTDGGETGEADQSTSLGLFINPNAIHGHGDYTEAMSLNDSLISMTTYKTMDMLGLYDIALMDNDRNYLSRSYQPFTTETRSNYQYDVDQDFAILGAMPGTCAGDFGTPEGAYINGGTLEQNAYRPFSPTGLGETQLAAWTVNWGVRSCFGGEGPYYYADPNAETVAVNGKTYYKYLRPDGRVYALVNKDDDGNWEYLYPTDERDAADPESSDFGYNGLGERFNRYKATWQTDYYMYVRNGLLQTVRLTVNNDDGESDMEMVSISNGDDAGRLTYHELIPEDEDGHPRACASPEEAFFRNYQWVYTEKKMVLIIPQSLSLIVDFGCVFMIFEAHGWSGLANMRLFKENHVWAKKGSNGSSDIPGDYRVELAVKTAGLGSLLVNEDTVYNDTLGRGLANPAIIGKNLPALYRLAFPSSPELSRGNDVYDREVGSRDFEVGDDIWQNRNAVAPIFFALLSAIEKNRVEWPDYDRNSLRNGILGMTNNLAPLLKPLIYYSTNNDDMAPRETWKMRVRGDQVLNNSEVWNGEQFIRPSIGFDVHESENVRWDGTDDEWEHYQPAVMKNLINVLVDSDITADFSEGKRMDGILPVMTEYKTMTNLFKILMSDVNETNDLYSALEQIITAMRFTEGRMTEINRAADATKKIPFPDWMFATGSGEDEFGFYTDFTGVRNEDIILDIGLDRLVGHDSFEDSGGTFHEGYGLAFYVDDQENLATPWEEFDEDMDLFEDLLHPDSEYSITESFIAMQDAIFARDTRYTEEQVAGMVYSLGKLFSRYDTETGEWVVQGDTGFMDLYNILKIRLPAIHNLVKDDTGENYHASLVLNSDMLAEEDNCGYSGMVPYIVDAMSTGEGAEQIMTDLAQFLDTSMVNEPAPLWSSLAQLLSDMATAVRNTHDGSLLESVYEDYGFQRNE